VLIKGGHLRGADAKDYLFDGDRLEEFGACRIPTRNTHGTGCTYSAAIVAYLAKGLAVTEAVRRAKAYTTEAIRHSLKLGRGHGPLNHFWRLESPTHTQE
jgi:hydroxymethylpyrimidine/phosphomethylpyrimidine kinase